MNNKLIPIYTSMPLKSVTEHRFEELSNKLSEKYSKLRDTTVNIISYGLRMRMNKVLKGLHEGIPVDLGTIKDKETAYYAVGIADRGLSKSNMLSISTDTVTVIKDGVTVTLTDFILNYGHQQQIFKDYDRDMFMKHLNIYCMYLYMTYGQEFAIAAMLYSLTANGFTATDEIRFHLSLYPYICAGAIAVMGVTAPPIIPIYGSQAQGANNGTVIVD